MQLRGGEDSYKIKKEEKIVLGKAEVLKEGKDITIIGIGKTVPRAMKLAEEIEKNGKSAEVINARFLKPFDKKTVKESIEKTKYVITIEDGTIINGLGTAVKELIVEEKIKDVKIQTYAYPDEFIKHGNVEELEKIYGVDEIAIYNAISWQ